MKRTRPKQAMSARELDRVQLVQRRLLKHLALAQAAAREVAGMLARAERR